MSIIFKEDGHSAADAQEPGSLSGGSGSSRFSRAIGADDLDIARRAGIVGVATLFSRILGAVRDIFIASFLGAGLVSDAFIAAFRVPDFLRRMFGEGSLSIAFVPAYTDCLMRHGRPQADQMANSAFRLLALVLLLITLAGIAAAPWLVHAVAPGFAKTADKFLLTITLTRTMLPYVFFIGLVALSMGILNVLGHFAAPALSPVLLNVAMIGALVIGAGFSGSEATLALWLAAGVVFGGALQMGLQVPFLVKRSVCFWQRARFWHPALDRVLWQMGPVMFGAAVFQINTLAITFLASFLPQGSVSYLYYADRLIQFPLGIFGIAMATAVLPAFARQSIAGQQEAMRETFSHAIKLVLFITLPATAGLMVLREPIVSLLFQRGAFDQQSMRLTAGALLYYGMGLWAFSTVRIVLNVFYALGDTRTPVRMAAICIAANLLLGALLMGPMAHQGLALAVSIASVLNLCLLVVALRKRLGALGGRDIGLSVFKSAICAAFMGLCIGLAAHWLLPAGTATGSALLPGLTGCVGLGILIYSLSARVMQMAELRTMLQIVRGRIQKR
jgi:putative peptidoglycan lipid II flippase